MRSLRYHKCSQLLQAQLCSIQTWYMIMLGKQSRRVQPTELWFAALHCAVNRLRLGTCSGSELIWRRSPMSTKPESPTFADVSRPCSVSTSTRQQVELPWMPFSSTVSAASFRTAAVASGQHAVSLSW